jgi:hypothetical protein
VKLPKQQADQLRKQALQARQEVEKLRKLHEQKHKETLEKINKIRVDQQKRLLELQLRQGGAGFQLQVQAPPVPVQRVQQIQVWGGPIAGSGIAPTQPASGRSEPDHRAPWPAAAGAHVLCWCCAHSGFASILASQQGRNYLSSAYHTGASDQSICSLNRTNH